MAHLETINTQIKLQNKVNTIFDTAQKIEVNSQVEIQLSNNWLQQKTLKKLIS